MQTTAEASSLCRFPRGSVKGMNADPRYLIGKFSPPPSISPQDRDSAIEAIAELPRKLRAAVRGLSEAQLDTPYREGGWTLRQTVHHIADSHMQSFGRMRLALTEDWPAICAYQEDQWAELADSRTGSVEPSLNLLEALHARWVVLLRSLDDADWSRRGFQHPVSGKKSIEQAGLTYAWHGRHHTAQIAALRQRMGW